MGIFFPKNRKTRALLLLVAYLPKAIAGPTRECDIRVRGKSVERLAVPLGAASTLQLSEDFDFAIPGNSRDFKTVTTPNPRYAVVQANATTAKETSLTLVMKSGAQVSLWLVPTSKDRGCILARIRRGL
ncbi:MAG: hypothetical protein JST16_03075 [Bdellovibrionales bacterium]|nr:hypothetical protein [Bdellovibrionales bacterium]